MTSPTDWSLALLLALVLGAAHHLDGPDYSADWAEAEAIEARQQEAAASARRDFSAQQACGPNAAFEWVSDTSIQCFTKRGAKTGKVAQL
jgi:hypothetical protein